MSDDQQAPLTGPDLREQGVPLADIADGGMLLGHALGKPVLLARHGDDVFAIGATCTHYGGPLAEGLLVGETVRCPWHHACFSVRTGEATCAPALRPVARWEIERRDGRVYVAREIEPLDGATPAPAARRATTASSSAPSSVGIIGGGAAGSAAAEMLRREGYDGPITMISADDAPPYDRPNVSKDYLAGNAPEEWIPLRPPEFYAEHRIELLTGHRVTALDAAHRRLTLGDGTTHDYGALLLATGADPVRLPAHLHTGIPVLYLRTLADSRAIIAAAAGAKRVVVLGASFIGLEVAASLRARGLEVHVVAPESRPLERVLGPELGDYVRALHDAHGVTFHLGRTAGGVDATGVTLGSGERIEADFVVAGIGVRPNLALAEGAGLLIDRGVAVNEYLETSAPGVYAAGDVARWPDPHSGERIRVEHWVVAQRQGQTAARNMLGARERYAAVPFFWSQHYDVAINYVGHAERWDEVAITGDVRGGDCTVALRSGGKTLAVVTVGRERASLEAEASLERDEPMSGGSPASLSSPPHAASPK
ncbi:MAG TPA: FAD-dependent oxidoreductase [Gemmatimonadaceae bacterium]|nr:FAD-dependent oxidoreductase [Gemmatimonadaceae bacterium]